MGVDRDCIEVGDDFVRVTRTVNAPIGRVFEYVIDVNPSHIFPRTGHSPAIVASSVTTGWNTPRLRRTNASDDVLMTAPRTGAAPRGTAGPALGVW
jgi:hypothetical protein